MQRQTSWILVALMLQALGCEVQELKGPIGIKTKSHLADRGIMGVGFDESAADTARIKFVLAGSTAEKAGLRPGDIVTAVNGAEIGSMQQVLSTTEELEPGDNVALDIVRGGDAVQVDVRLMDYEEFSALKQKARQHPIHRE